MTTTVNFLAYHVAFVNKSHVLRSEMQSQLLSTFEDKMMPYSKQGEFNFCNIQSWAESDPESIKNFVSNLTLNNGGNASAV
jgi:hypothetical protein